MPAAPLQIAPTSRPVSLLGTFLLGWAFLAFTAQVAARFFLRRAPWQNAVLVGLASAVVSMTLVLVSPLLTVAVGLVVDAIVIRWRYAVDRRTTVLMAVFHYAATVALAFVLVTVLSALVGAP